MKKIILCILISFLNGANILAEAKTQSPLQCEYFKIKKGYSPYLVKLKNVSDAVITIDPIVIENSIITYDEVIKRGRIFMMVSTGILFFAESVIGGVLSTTCTGKLAKSIIIGSTAAITYASYVLLSVLQKNAENNWQKKMLREHELITINPGETIDKIFWIKNSGPFNFEYKIVESK